MPSASPHVRRRLSVSAAYGRHERPSIDGKGAYVPHQPPVGSSGVAAADLTPDKPAPRYEAYAAKVREAVERRLLKDRMERATSAVRDWSRISLKDIPVEGGIYKLPADWKGLVPKIDDFQPAQKPCIRTFSV